jgi:hypothetical protein
MHEILDEALDEATGRSSKRWALVVVCVVLGAVLALWLTGRRLHDVRVPPTGETSEPPADPPNRG